MCRTCGCENISHKRLTDKQHAHAHKMGHAHSHDHDHTHEHETVIDLEQKVLEKNDLIAERNKKFAAKHGITIINIISSPGSGKTLLLETTLKLTRKKIKCAVITGDVETDMDAARLKKHCPHVWQIKTRQACHLSADQIGRLLPSVAKTGAKLLFIENVGNLVCPSAFDLGENFKMAVLSVAEGEEKPVKYPLLFSLARIAVITKVDLLPHIDYNIKLTHRYLQKIHPGIFVFETSSKSGKGIKEWINYLEKLA